MQISEPAEYAILGLLYTEARHGYELFQQFEHGILGEIVHLEMSQMYAFLKKLERLGYIKSEVTTQGTRPPRKVLYLTAEGRDVFLNWLQQPAEKPRDIRILYLIKLYFVQRILPAQTSQLLEKQVQACQQFLASLEARQKEMTTKSTNDAEFFDQVVLRSRIYQTRALLDWLYELKTEIGISH
jgi:DNA-binding PadR family transcriptional regulator